MNWRQVLFSCCERSSRARSDLRRLHCSRDISSFELVMLGMQSFDEDVVGQSE